MGEKKTQRFFPRQHGSAPAASRKQQGVPLLRACCANESGLTCQLPPCSGCPHPTPSRRRLQLECSQGWQTAAMYRRCRYQRRCRCCRRHGRCCQAVRRREPLGSRRWWCCPRCRCRRWCAGKKPAAARQPAWSRPDMPGTARCDRANGEGKQQHSARDEHGGGAARSPSQPRAIPPQCRLPLHPRPHRCPPSQKVCSSCAFSSPCSRRRVPSGPSTKLQGGGGEKSGRGHVVRRWAPLAGRGSEDPDSHQTAMGWRVQGRAAAARRAATCLSVPHACRRCTQGERLPGGDGNARAGTTGGGPRLQRSNTISEAPLV